MTQAERRSRRTAYVGIFAFILWLASIVLLGLYAKQLNDRTERKFCAVISASTPTDAPPPTTERGQKAFAAMRDLSRDLGCSSH
jgi:hypothetical protein